MDQIDGATNRHVFGWCSSKHLFENLAGDFCIIECLVGIEGNAEVFGDGAELLILCYTCESAKCHLECAERGEVGVDIDCAEFVGENTEVVLGIVGDEHAIVDEGIDIGPVILEGVRGINFFSG